MKLNPTKRSFDVWKRHITGSEVDLACGLEQLEDEISNETIKHGFWVDRTADDNDIVKPWQGKYRCSVCGIALNQNWFMYCPHCGSKIDEGDKDD